jgi:HK97 family phage prohead protease
MPNAKPKPDFSGYATKYGVKCTDGRTIQADAFAHLDEARLPLVWQHNISDATNILGHAVLEHRSGDGVYVYGYFNDTHKGKHAKATVAHGDITSLSIFADRLVQNGTPPNLAVVHGDIKEVSLVVSGANKGARIDNTAFAHGDSVMIDDESAVIYSDISLDEITHEADPIVHQMDKSNSRSEFAAIQTAFNGLNEKQRRIIGQLIFQADHTSDVERNFRELSDEDKQQILALTTAVMSHSDISHDDEETIGDILASMTDKQKLAVAALLAPFVQDTAEHSDLNTNNKGESNMQHNVFDTSKSGPKDNQLVLQHSDFCDLLATAKQGSGVQSLKALFNDTVLGMKQSLAQASHDEGIAHADYGITDIEVLFPEARNVRSTPDMIDRDTGWVGPFLSKTHKNPFARIKSQSADITADEARAKGYVTGRRKIEEVITVAKRTTVPTLVYKRQKLDREHILEITDFDVVSWLKAEMRSKLDEEIARAILIGDGRLFDSPDKIDESCIRPIWKDDPLYVTTVVLPTAKSGPLDFAEAIIRNRRRYKGTGMPNLYTTEEDLSDLLLMKDGDGRYMFDDIEKLKLKMRINDIVTVEVMEGKTREVGGQIHKLRAILVNPADYSVGTNRGGEVTFFDFFDIDFNQNKYLYETQMSGCLTKPFSAVVIESLSAASPEPTPTV